VRAERRLPAAPLPSSALAPDMIARLRWLLVGRRRLQSGAAPRGRRSAPHPTAARARTGQQPRERSLGGEPRQLKVVALRSSKGPCRHSCSPASSLGGVPACRQPPGQTPQNQGTIVRSVPCLSTMSRTRKDKPIEIARIAITFPIRPGSALVSREGISSPLRPPQHSLDRPSPTAERVRPWSAVHRHPSRTGRNHGGSIGRVP
jgi:hypothetical protein